MILSQADLRLEVEKKTVVFDPPLDESQWGQASVDLRLGKVFTCLKKHSGIKISVSQGLNLPPGFWVSKELKEDDGFGRPEAFCLDPGQFVLAMTYESIKIPNNLIALVEGRSTYARVGLSMHQTAPWIQPGWSGQIVLEIMNNGPLALELTPIIDRPCQLTFFQLSSPLPTEKAYGSKKTDIYQDQQHPLKPRTAKKKRER